MGRHRSFGAPTLNPDSEQILTDASISSLFIALYDSRQFISLSNRHKHYMMGPCALFFTKIWLILAPTTTQNDYCLCQLKIITQQSNEILPLLFPLLLLCK